MCMSQVIVKRKAELSEDELLHGKFKYIKKEPDGKGGWKYYYGTEGSMQLYRKTSGDPKSQYGTYVTNNPGFGPDGFASKGKRTIEVRKSNKWLGSTKESIDPNSGDVHEIREEGKLDRALDKDKAKAAISKHAKKTMRSIEKKTNKGKKWLSKKLGIH